MRTSKERGNYPVGCMEFKCVNRNILCDDCYRKEKVLNCNSLSELRRITEEKKEQDLFDRRAENLRKIHDTEEGNS